MRIQSRLFWTPLLYNHPQENDEKIPNLVEITDEVTYYFRNQSYSSNMNYGGLIFGVRIDEVIHVVLATSIGCPQWYEDSDRAILDVDSRFALGWSESLQVLFNKEIDWVGNWWMHADAEAKNSIDDVKILKKGIRMGIFNDRNILMIIGWKEKDLEIKAYHQLTGGEWSLIECRPLSGSTYEILGNMIRKD